MARKSVAAVLRAGVRSRPLEFRQSVFPLSGKKVRDFSGDGFTCPKTRRHKYKPTRKGAVRCPMGNANADTVQTRPKPNGTPCIGRAGSAADSGLRPNRG